MVVIVILVAITTQCRLDYDRRNWIRRIIGGWPRSGLARPASEIAWRRGRRRTWRRLDFQPAVARPMARFREVTWLGRARNCDEQRPVNDSRCHQTGPVEAEFAVDDTPRRIDAVDDHRNPRPAGDND